MPRLPRIHLDNVPLHIVQRGHNRQPCFFAEADYLVVLIEPGPFFWVVVIRKKLGQFFSLRTYSKISGICQQAKGKT